MKTQMHDTLPSDKADSLHFFLRECVFSSFSMWSTLIDLQEPAFQPAQFALFDNQGYLLATTNADELQRVADCQKQITSGSVGACVPENEF